MAAFSRVCVTKLDNEADFGPGGSRDPRTGIFGVSFRKKGTVQTTLGIEMLRVEDSERKIKEEGLRGLASEAVRSVF